jgi:hypothetical protein
MQLAGVALLLVLRTYDMVGLTAAELAGAQRTATAILGQARIDVSWVSCVAVPVAPHDHRCDQARRPAELIVRIIAAPVHLTNAALADAYIEKNAALGSFATLYADRVRTMAAAGGLDPGTLMGRAIAHEVGHLLSGTTSHSASGLMRAGWSAPMLRRDVISAWTFSSREAERLRVKLGERLAPASAVQIEVIDQPSTSPQQIAEKVEVIAR